MTIATALKDTIRRVSARESQKIMRRVRRLQRQVKALRQEGRAQRRIVAGVERRFTRLKARALRTGVSAGPGRPLTPQFSRRLSSSPLGRAIQSTTYGDQGRQTPARYRTQTGRLSIASPRGNALTHSAWRDRRMTTGSLSHATIIEKESGVRRQPRAASDASGSTAPTATPAAVSPL